MPLFIKHFFLGLIQGISEFLPISSSGHLILAQNFLGTDQVFFLTIAAHFGTLFSLIIFYRKNLVYIFKNILNPLSKNLFLKIVTGCLPAGIVGFLFYDEIKEVFSNLFVVGLGFLLTAAFLIRTKWIPIADRKDKMESYSELESISYLQVLFIGIFQILALFPGVSRSGITTSSGMIFRLHPSVALHFSFLMGTLILLAATSFELSKTSLETFLSASFSVTFMSSFVFGYIALRIMKGWVFKLYKIGVYPLLLGALLLLAMMLAS